MNECAHDFNAQTTEHDAFVLGDDGVCNVPVITMCPFCQSPLIYPVVKNAAS
jgi:hypothetical protein